MEYNLSEFGIKQHINLLGSLDILRRGIASPTIFLIDEYHCNRQSIRSNVQNAIELVNKAKVDIIGVESHAGGKEWDQKNQVYISNKYYDYNLIKIYESNCPCFVNLLKEVSNIHCIYGVDCWDMTAKIQVNMDVNDNPYYRRKAEDHPLNKKRSEHFIRTIFGLRKNFNLNGNLILNCGKNHNTHIEEWVFNGSIDEITFCPANYIRLNTIDN